MNETTTPLPLCTIQHKYGQFLAKATEVGENDVYSRANCKFCNHPSRAEAEAKWERSGSYAMVEKVFADYHNEHPDVAPLSYINVKGHLDRHYAEQMRRLRMREYAENLQEVLKERVNNIEMLNALSTSLQLKFVDLASSVSLESAKQADAMVKVAKILVDIEKFRAELNGDIKPINVFAEKVLNVWTSAIQSESDEAMKRKLVELLNALEVDVGAATVNGS